MHEQEQDLHAMISRLYCGQQLSISALISELHRRDGRIAVSDSLRAAILRRSYTTDEVHTAVYALREWAGSRGNQKDAAPLHAAAAWLTKSLLSE